MSNWTKDLTIGKPDTIGTMIYGPHGASVAWCGCGAAYDSGGSYSISPAEAHANAKLYASAPELVDAVRQFVNGMDLYERGIYLSQKDQDAIIGRARAALTKAGAA